MLVFYFQELVLYSKHLVCILKLCELVLQFGYLQIIEVVVLFLLSMEPLVAARLLSTQVY